MNPAAALATACAVLLAGCGSPGPDLPEAWQGRDVEGPGWMTARIFANGSLGLEYNWPAGREVSWDWVAETDQPLNLSLIYMAGQQALPVGGQHNTAGRGEYTTRQAGVYHLVWDPDRAADVTLHFKAPEGARRSDYLQGQGPGCVGGSLRLC